MAQFGPFAVVRAQQLAPQFAVTFAYVEEALRAGSEINRRILAVPAGTSHRVELGGGVFAMEQAYWTKARPEGFFEAHRRYIDVQVIVAGAEAMEVDDVARLTVTMPYDAERDFEKFTNSQPASRLIVRAGDIALFFPADGHMPSLHERDDAQVVQKTVVKVPVF